MKICINLSLETWTALRDEAERRSEQLRETVYIQDIIRAWIEPHVKKLLKGKGA